jgi:hypothetical protein
MTNLIHVRINCAGSVAPPEPALEFAAYPLMQREALKDQFECELCIKGLARSDPGGPIIGANCAGDGAEG